MASPPRPPAVTERSFTVHGRVRSARSAGTAGLFVELVARDVARDERVGSAVTGADGRYRVTFAPRSELAPDLQVRAWSHDAADAAFLGESEVRYDAGPAEALDVELRADAAGLPSELEALTAALRTRYDGPLAALEESDVRQDVTYLANKTGWDARVVAMAARAEQLAADAPEIPAPLFYALLRAGLPERSEALHRARPDAVERVWRDAIAQDVIPRRFEADLPDALAAFERTAAEQALTARPVPGTSSLAELLEPTFPGDTDRQRDFVLRHIRDGDSDGFWDDVEREFGRAARRRLERDGALAELTLNNAPLVAALSAPDAGGALADVAELAARGYHRAERWLDVLGANVPDAIPGGRDGYAELLAARVRTRFPTAVVAAQVRSGELLSDTDARTRAQVHDFLAANAGRFELGREPLERWLATAPDAAPPAGARAAGEIKRLQRVYQLTPDDRAMQVLLDRELDSAASIAAHDPDAFAADRAGDLGEADARLIHARAQQIHDAVLNLATSYLTARVAPQLGGADEALLVEPLRAPAADASPVAALPTLEGLFGAMDYCACEHCRSLLSPAAYLVDLLGFLDRTVGGVNPLDAFLARRPDVEHLPLTCENTNTPLPHIDLVNETLEHFVAQRLTLRGYAGHDTGGDVTPEQLLARPQYVDERAYGTLAGEFHPAPLPFHKPLETLRSLFAELGVPLWQAMTELRAGDALARPSERDFGWDDILIERLGLSRPEHRLLTDRALTLQQLYGLPAATTPAAAVTELTGVKLLARSLGVSYEELVALLLTRFVNPGRAIVLAPPPGADADSFEQLRLTRPGGRPLTAVDFVRTARFVRLWRKLGWTIAETDAAIAALYPNASAVGADDAARLDAGCVALVRRLAIAVATAQRLDLAPAERASLLACWAPIDTHGPASLAARLFAAGGPALGQGRLGDDGVGDWLRAALRLSADELTAIRAALGYTDATPLTLDAVSAIHRRGWLAGALGLTVHELLALTRLTGIDPFAVPEPPAPGIWRLLDLLDALRDAGLTPAGALELLWSEALPGTAPSTAAADDDDRHALARALRAALAAVDGELSPAGVDGARARDLLAAAFGAAAADVLSGVLEGSLSVTVPYRQASPSLAGPIVGAADGRIAYDPVAGALSYAGPMSRRARDALTSVSRASQMFKEAVAALFAAGAARSAGDVVFAGSDAAITALLADRPQLRAALVAYAASAQPGETRRTAFLAAALPALRDERRRAAALATAARTAGADPSLASALLADGGALHAANDPSSSALADLLALAEGGLVREPAASRAETLTWSALLEVPRTGSYDLGATVASARGVRLTVGGVAVARGAGGRGTTAIALDADRLHAVTVVVRGSQAIPSLSWRADGGAWQPLPARQLYAPQPLAALQATSSRFARAVALARALRLTGAELAHRPAGSDLAPGGRSWLNAVRTAPADAPAPALARALEAVLLLARLKAALSPDDERLLTALGALGTRAPDAPGALLALTGWDGASFAALLRRFALQPAELGDPRRLARVAGAHGVLSTLGITAERLLAGTTNAPDAAAVRVIERALQARLGPDAWLTVQRSINDPLRRSRRDALVAYILRELGRNVATAHVDTPDKLFEHFLMDVQMEPCMQTSRIRHALSSVQLFVERVLMNLERGVPPATVNRARWEWMKRYRVWEANRKVFLWPENWLEPELRDDQSSFFRQTMSQLLQSDITEDVAASALLGYLSSLEEVAKLEPCSIHYVEGEQAAGDEIAHVVARTAGAKRAYYYRRRAHGAWSPWEPIAVDIEDNPVSPVVWKGRLLLFWLKIVQNGPPPPPPPPATDTTRLADVPYQKVRTEGVRSLRLTPQAVLCWSEYYDGRWQPTKTSNIDAPASLGRAFELAGSGAFDRGRLVIGETTEGDALRVRFWGQSGGSSFLLYNTHSLPLRQEDQQAPLDIASGATLIREMDVTGTTFAIRYISEDSKQPAVRPILVKRDNGRYDTVEPFHISYHPDTLQQSLIQDVWTAPFFFGDSRHTFYVSTDRIRSRGTFGVVPWRPQPMPILPLTLRRGDAAEQPPPAGDGPIEILLEAAPHARAVGGQLTPQGRSAPPGGVRTPSARQEAGDA